MQLKAIIANTLWGASNLPAHWRYRRALAEPQVTQGHILRSYLERNVDTAFGKAHGFEKIRGYEEFSRRVPLADYQSLESWISRIRRGETTVLTSEPVTHLVPTSGSTGARKLVPFTAGLQREFNAAIGPWMVDLQRQSPGIILGAAYWSVTPALQPATAEESAVPIGFEADTAYLGGARRRLVEAVMAVPSKVQRAGSLETFQFETLLHLLRCRDLRLISVWHPSFLTLLIDALPTHWTHLLQEIRRGRETSLAPLPRRADELNALGPHDPAALWPELRVISCWGDGNAESAMVHLQRRFPRVMVQRKGLLATEAVVTIPFCSMQPLAIRSHFFEFLDENERVRLPHELRVGEEVEVVVTTAGGLWRYRLFDRMRVDGFVGRTPSFRFLGRKGNVSDRFGEKLSEAFVSAVLRQMMGEFGSLPSFTLLAPDEDQRGWWYTLYLEGDHVPDLAMRLDDLLKENPQYAWCRNLGQLQAPRVFRIQGGGYQAYVARESAGGKRIGEVKPCALSLQAGWSLCFEGDYVDLEPTVRP